MDSLVLLGAGASALAGMPVSNDLRSALSEHLAEPLVTLFNNLADITSEGWMISPEIVRFNDPLFRHWLDIDETEYARDLRRRANVVLAAFMSEA